MSTKRIKLQSVEVDGNLIFGGNRGNRKVKILKIIKELEEKLADQHKDRPEKPVSETE